MGKIGKYIYGIIPGGITPSGEVYTIPYQDISAVVGNWEIIDYTKLPKDDVARLLIGHQKVIEKIMEDFTVIPMRLGTFAGDENEVRYILTKGYPMIKEVLNDIYNKIEIDVAATWSDFNSVLKELGKEKEIKEIKEKLAANPKSISIDEQMKVGVMVKKALDEKRDEYAGRIQNVLKDISEVSKVHELMNDETVINAAFLIDKARSKDFEDMIEKLNSEFNEKLNFRCVGPLPPYSFYTLEIKKMQFGEVDWARRKLGLLNDFATKKEIKKAYQMQALSSHPDKNPNALNVEKNFDDINKAFNVLTDYCLACEQAGEKEKCCFKKEEFEKNAILIKVRE